MRSLGLLLTSTLGPDSVTDVRVSPSPATSTPRERFALQASNCTHTMRRFTTGTLSATSQLQKDRLKFRINLIRNVFLSFIIVGPGRVKSCIHIGKVNKLSSHMRRGLLARYFISKVVTQTQNIIESPSIRRDGLVSFLSVVAATRS
ncbi:uncharacterized protein CLUP02_14162 [Colletotrichum lupini]|uniref:Uncharacterized protein n=1 Tax=Colletotrichum lupini TaxID=145971 RepID=A0A9Q8T5M4_9PEZI|nr:uncharacterized protein CLUP02_14162 [Colletotrichum lupini]UQC88637.1 hypothetical protein CLUP02_14162 [Colletotrichum lupini]